MLEMLAGKDREVRWQRCMRMSRKAAGLAFSIVFKLF